MTFKFSHIYIYLQSSLSTPLRSLIFSSLPCGQQDLREKPFRELHSPRSPRWVVFDPRLILLPFGGGIPSPAREGRWAQSAAVKADRVRTRALHTSPPQWQTPAVEAP